MKTRSVAKRRVLAFVVALVMAFSLLPSPLFAAGEETHYMGITSDVHGATSNISTWLSNNGSDLEYMVFGGDSSTMYWEPNTISSMQAIFSNSYRSIAPIITMGNHDWMSGSESAFETATGKTRTGIQNDPDQDGYAIYTLGASSSAYQGFEFPENDRAALQAALNAADSNKPFFVVSHYPLHYGESRQGTGVSALIDILNAHSNVFFFWGHNHHSDPNIGSIKISGDTITPADATSSSRQIEFTYCNSGHMGNEMYGSGGNDGTGVRVAIVKSEDGTDVTLEYRAPNGSVSATKVVSLGEDSGGGESGNPGGAYVLAATPESGSQYVIVARTDGGDYALTTESMTSGQGQFLIGKAVTIVGDTITAGVTGDMIWDFVLDTATAFDIRSGSQYLNRQAHADGSSSGLYVGSEASAGYSDWTYNGSTHNLSTHSASGDIDFYMRALTSGGSTYFRNDYIGGEISSAPSHVYLYKVTGGGGETPPAEISYQLSNGLVAGDTYVVVAKSGSIYYALTNAVASTDFLAGTQVTVQGDEVVATGVTSAMLWKAESAPKYMYLRNGGGYLKRVSGPEGKLNASSSVPGEGYGEWVYSGSQLYTISTSSQGTGSKFALTYESGTSGHFMAEYQGTGVIYLYKLTQGTPVEDQPIASVSLTGIAAPVAGATPVGSATVGLPSYSAGPVTWAPSVSDSFEHDTVYTASVTLTASTGYLFNAATTATVNGNTATSKTLNPNGTLTITYVFPKTALAPATSYQLSSSLVAGETYVVVAKSGSSYYALTNAVASTDFLAGTQVTVQGEDVVATGVTSSMLWKAETAPKYTYLRNGTGYLKRVSGPEGKLNASSSVPGEGYGEWIYNGSKLYTVSTSSQGAGSEFALQYNSTSPRCFKAEYNGTETIYLYKLSESAPDKEITAVASLDDIDVDYGTALASVGLPPTVSVTLDDSTTRDLAVSWDEGSPIYDGNTAGVYQFEGTLTLVTGISNTAGMKAAVKVNVAAAPEITLTGITAAFDQGSTVVLNTHGLSVLHQMLTVTATYSDESTAILTSDQYQLSGTLYSGSPIITVTYQEKSATFVVKVTSGGTSGGGTIPGGDTPGGGTTQPGGDTPLPEEPTPLGFGDVQEGDWFYDAVKYVLDKGLFKGTSDTTFEPNTPMTRGMFVTVLSRIEFGSDDDVPEGTSLFTDLTQDWYKNAVAWAAANGIVNGLSDTEFGPDVPVTREQMAAILYRYAEYKELDTTFDEADIADFEDVEAVSDYALDPMKWAVSKGLITGKTSTTLAPKESATRAQVATIVMRFGAFAE